MLFCYPGIFFFVIFSIRSFVSMPCCRSIRSFIHLYHFSPIDVSPLFCCCPIGTFIPLLYCLSIGLVVPLTMLLPNWSTCHPIWPFVSWPFGVQWISTLAFVIQLDLGSLALLSDWIRFPLDVVPMDIFFLSFFCFSIWLLDPLLCCPIGSFLPWVNQIILFYILCLNIGCV